VHHGNATDRDRGDVRCAVIAVVVRPVDRVVLEPLDVRMQVADYFTLEADRFALVDRLVAGATLDDRRMRQTRYSVTIDNDDFTMTSPVQCTCLHVIDTMIDTICLTRRQTVIKSTRRLVRLKTLLTHPPPKNRIGRHCQPTAWTLYNRQQANFPLAPMAASIHFGLTIRKTDILSVEDPNLLVTHCIELADGCKFRSKMSVRYLSRFIRW